MGSDEVLYHEFVLTSKNFIRTVTQAHRSTCRSLYRSKQQITPYDIRDANIHRAVYLMYLYMVNLRMNMQMCLSPLSIYVCMILGYMLYDICIYRPCMYRRVYIADVKAMSMRCVASGCWRSRRATTTCGTSRSPRQGPSSSGCRRAGCVEASTWQLEGQKGRPTAPMTWGMARKGVRAVDFAPSSAVFGPRLRRFGSC